MSSTSERGASPRLELFGLDKPAMTRRAGFGRICGSILLAGLFASAAGCRASGADLYPLFDRQDLVTQHNLRIGSRMTAQTTNYIGESILIPRCSPVELVSLNQKQLQFRLRQSGVVYTLQFIRKYTPGPIASLVSRTFGPDCEPIDTLSAVDREGIETASIIEGMSKKGVVLAVGYPPDHATPSLEGDVWKYWKGRVDTLELTFENGYLVEIHD